ncbi:MAG TPA: methyltransferase domain-containing protein [Ktedonobacteraceae bacterium]|jgi:ubiquinone/menaquinone biosynthesis C-methylase UbiE|nr:methyltransferase domain-containing protein [Ktedonobacteraceae bacterium]
MAVDEVIHVNEYGLPLNAIEWLETHHQSKMFERERMIRDLQLKKGSLVVDAGCGPGLWTPLLAKAIGPQGQIIGVDISPEALITAQCRSTGTWYRHQVQYKLANLEHLPVEYGQADIIFSANVSQYLADPVSTFAAMGPYLTQGGRLVIKDIDFGTMRFSTIDPELQARVFQARERWEQERTDHGYAFEDSWVGSKLAGYLREAGYQQVREKSYIIQRQYPLSKDFRFYLQGIAEWFVCEGAPYLSGADVTRWLSCFLDEYNSVLDQETFVSEETEFVVTGTWNPPTRSYYYFLEVLEGDRLVR